IDRYHVYPEQLATGTRGPEGGDRNFAKLPRRGEVPDGNRAGQGATRQAAARRLAALYAGAILWHLSRVPFPLPIAPFAVLALVGCVTPQQKQAKLVAKAEKQRVAQNTRASEQRRMLAIENREVNSNRGAQILEY